MDAIGESCEIHLLRCEAPGVAAVREPGEVGDQSRHPVDLVDDERTGGAHVGRVVLVDEFEVAAHDRERCLQLMADVAPESLRPAGVSDGQLEPVIRRREHALALQEVGGRARDDHAERGDEQQCREDARPSPQTNICSLSTGGPALPAILPSPLSTRQRGRGIHRMGE